MTAAELDLMPLRKKKDRAREGAQHTKEREGEQGKEDSRKSKM